VEWNVRTQLETHTSLFAFGALLALHIGHVVLGALFAEPQQHTMRDDLAIGVLNIAYVGAGIWVLLELRGQRLKALALCMCALSVVGGAVSMPFFVLSMNQPKWVFMLVYDGVYLTWAVTTIWILTCSGAGAAEDTGGMRDRHRCRGRE
jgi:hypothetical protein